MHPRRRESDVNWRPCDIAIDFEANRFPRLRCAWCDDCVCIEEASRQAHSLPENSKCRRAARSKIRPNLTRESNCLHDLRAFPCDWSLCSNARTFRFVQCTFAERRRPRFRRSMGSSPNIIKRYAASDCLGFVRPRNCSKQWTDKLFFDWKRLWHFILIGWGELKTSESGTKLWREEQSPIVEKERKPTLRGKWLSVFSGSHMDKVRNFSHVVSVMTDKHKETRTAVRGEKDGRPLPHQTRRPRLTAREKHPQKLEAIEMEALRTKEPKFRADTKLK